MGEPVEPLPIVPLPGEVGLPEGLTPLVPLVPMLLLEPMPESDVLGVAPEPDVPEAAGLQLPLLVLPMPDGEALLAGLGGQSALAPEVLPLPVAVPAAPVPIPVPTLLPLPSVPALMPEVPGVVVCAVAIPAAASSATMNAIEEILFMFPPKGIKRMALGCRKEHAIPSPAGNRIHLPPARGETLQGTRIFYPNIQG